MNSLNTYAHAHVPFTAFPTDGGSFGFSLTTDANYSTFETFGSPTSSNLSALQWAQINVAGDYHQFDNVVLEIGPTIDTITPVSPDPRSTNVSRVDVTFNEAIDSSSFTFADIALLRDGSPVTLDNSVSIAHANGTTYSINGLSSFTGDDGGYVLTVNALNILSPSGLQGAGTVSDTWTTAVPVTVTGTTPSLIGGTLAAGLTSLDVNFSNHVVGGGDAANYEVRSQGVDGVLGNADDDLVSLSVSYASNTATLSFAALAEGLYRLTVKDSILSTAGAALDGEEDDVAGGDFIREFVVGSQSHSLTSRNGFVFDSGFGGWGAGQLVQGTANAFDGLNRLQVNGIDYAPDTPIVPKISTVDA